MKVKFYADPAMNPHGGYVGVKSLGYEDLITNPETLLAATAAVYSAAAEYGANDNAGASAICYELKQLGKALEAVSIEWAAHSI